MKYRVIRPGKIERLVRSIALRYQHLGVWTMVSRDDLRQMIEGDAKLQLDLGLYTIHPLHLEEIKTTVDKVLKDFEAILVLQGVAPPCSDSSSETS